MADDTSTEWIQSLKALVEDLEAEEADHLARERYLASRQRKRYDTRRQVLVGKLVLELATKDERIGQWLTGQLNTTLTHPLDRELFGLPIPVPAPPPEPRTNWK